jgi:hypothetical protein
MAGFTGLNFHLVPGPWYEKVDGRWSMAGFTGFDFTWFLDPDTKKSMVDGPWPISRFGFLSITGF